MGNDCNSNGCSDCDANCGFNGNATVTLNLDNGQVVECQVLTIYHAADRQYVALLPLDENGENHDGEVYLYRFNENGGEPQLDNIGDDAEYEAASDGFEEWLDTQEFDEIVSAEDEDAE